MRVVAGVCSRHGFYRGSHCPVCAGARPKSTLHVITHNWIKTEKFEHIDPNQTMRFDSKKELIAACERTGNYCKAFMKPKSQGKGWEHSRGYS